MNAEEINSKWESLKRTEKAITDDILKIRDRRQTLEIAYPAPPRNRSTSSRGKK
jgi:hypothetical protein